MSAIDRAMGYYKAQYGRDGWARYWVADLDRARCEGLLVLTDEVVLVAWPVETDFTEECGESLYVHLAVGRLAALADVDVPWRWLCWQRGLRSQKWHWARSVRVLERLRAGRGC